MLGAKWVTCKIYRVSKGRKPWFPVETGGYQVSTEWKPPKPNAPVNVSYVSTGSRVIEPECKVPLI